jgi:hypothetical protein
MQQESQPHPLLGGVPGGRGGSRRGARRAGWVKTATENEPLSTEP